MTTRREALIELTRTLTANGKLIEAGWIGMQLACIPDDAPTVQLVEMRIAFFAGAQHVYGSIMNMLDPGAEPTDADLQRMEMIDKELKIFIAEFEKKHKLHGESH
jgi:hypothetical protein